MKCKDCNVKVLNGYVRCPSCRGKNTELRKYKRRHQHRLNLLRKKRNLFNS